MPKVVDFSLFPNKEEWGTGDEAMDNRLSIALKKVKDDLSIPRISEFYFYGLSLKPRAYNPAFHSTIELVTKAFLYCLYPDEPNDLLMKKIKGDYDNKEKITFDFPEKTLILEELKSKKIYRYQGQIDFYLNLQHNEERNPYVRQALKRANLDLHVKIIMKDFKSFLSGEKEITSIKDPFFQALKMGHKILVIDNFAEIWYHQDQIFSLPTFNYN